MSEFAILAAFAFGIWQFYRGKKIGRNETEQEFSNQQRLGYLKAVDAFDKLASGDITEDQWRNPSYDLFQPALEDLMRWQRG